VQTSQTTFIDEAIQTDAAINPRQSGGRSSIHTGKSLAFNSASYTPADHRRHRLRHSHKHGEKHRERPHHWTAAVHRDFSAWNFVGRWLVGEALDLPARKACW